MSTKKKQISQLFLTKLFEFIDDVLLVFPDNTDLKRAKLALKGFKNLNHSLIVKSWNNYVYLPYKDIIDREDIEYFIDKDYNSELNGVEGSDEISRVIDELRKPIKDMSDENKHKCMKYITILCLLSDSYVNCC